MNSEFFGRRTVMDANYSDHPDDHPVCDAVVNELAADRAARRRWPQAVFTQHDGESRVARVEDLEYIQSEEFDRYGGHLVCVVWPNGRIS